MDISMEIGKLKKESLKKDYKNTTKYNKSF